MMFKGFKPVKKEKVYKLPTYDELVEASILEQCTYNKELPGIPVSTDTWAITVSDSNDDGIGLTTMAHEDMWFHNEMEDFKKLSNKEQLDRYNALDAEHDAEMKPLMDAYHKRKTAMCDIINANGKKSVDKP